MKRYPEFVYNAIDNQSIVYTNQLKMSDWNNIINVLRTQANANTTFLETWTRWFFGPKEYIEEDEYVTIPEGYTNYFDYLTGMFTEIDTCIKNEIDDRTAADTELREYINSKHDIAMSAIAEEEQQRTAKDAEIQSDLTSVTNITNRHTATLSLMAGDISRHRETLQQHTEDIDNLVIEDSNINRELDTLSEDLEAKSTALENRKLNTDFSGLNVASAIHQDDAIIVKCNGVTYTTTVKVLTELINSEVDYFKGYHSTLDNLKSAHYTGEPGDYAFVGSFDGQYHMYVWDNLANDGQGAWEETISGQYVLTSAFDSFKQGLQEGSIHVGSVKGNVSDTSESDEVLVNLEINGKQFILPTAVFDFLGMPVEGAHNLGAIKINDDVWNINSNLVSFELSDEPVEGAYELGSITIEGNTWNVVKFSDVYSQIDIKIDELKQYITANSFNKGEFLTLESLQELHPTARPGEFAFVNTPTDQGDIMLMYIWDSDSSMWKETTSGQYVLNSTFEQFKQEIEDRLSNAGGNVAYTNTTPTPQALGGIPKGTTFDNKSITEVLNMLLYPYVTFSVSISTSPNGGTFEKSASKTISGCTVSITKGSASITSITVKYGNEVKATKTENIGTSNSFTFDTPITITSSSSYKNFTVTAIDSTEVSKSNTSGTFTFVDPYYYGVTSKDASSITASNITSMTKDIKSKGSKSYTYNMSQQRAVIAYPASYGTLSSVKDSQNNDNLSLFTRTEVTINEVNYYVYVTTKSQTNKISLTFNH